MRTLFAVHRMITVYSSAVAVALVVSCFRRCRYAGIIIKLLLSPWWCLKSDALKVRGECLICFFQVAYRVFHSFNITLL